MGGNAWYGFPGALKNKQNNVNIYISQSLIDGFAICNIQNHVKSARDVAKFDVAEQKWQMNIWQNKTYGKYTPQRCISKIAIKHNSDCTYSKQSPHTAQNAVQPKMHVAQECLTCMSKNQVSRFGAKMWLNKTSRISKIQGQHVKHGISNIGDLLFELLKINGKPCMLPSKSAKASCLEACKCRIQSLSN